MSYNDGLDRAGSQGLGMLTQAPSQVMPGGMGQGMEIIEEGTDMVQMQTEGTPWMEVWVQRNEDGTFNRQTTLLRPPMDDLQLLKVQPLPLLCFGIREGAGAAG